MLIRAIAATFTLLAPLAHAGGPRFVTGSQFGAVVPGQFMAFRTNQPHYFTDAGNLGPAVSHAQADTMVAAAAAVWNTPTSSLVFVQGGTLAEDVNGANVFFGNTGIVWPADVMASNYLAVPIAVVYDADGSITDLLLGEGASDPAGCRQAGVTESVDAFGQSGTIDHAILVLNGRCVSGGIALSQELLQLQYQLTRAFGRILGLAWSQLNDNVFTGATATTLVERQAWPLMHPIDIICGPYTYQCTVNPFSLREDDIAALDLLYPVPSSNTPAGKIWTLQNAVSLEGWIRFPNGQGMDQLNVTVQRNYAGQSYVQPWQVVSGITGSRQQANHGNPVTGPPPPDTEGSFDWDSPAFFTIGRIDVGYTGNLWLTTEPINPLYIGAYAIGPYQRPAATPSGSTQTMAGLSEQPGYMNAFWDTVADASPSCSPNDGSEGAPAMGDPGGWWPGQLCGAGHTSWWGVSVKPGRTWTLEATALNEAGSATANKAQPVIGVWNAGDPPGTLPTVAAQGFAMNAMSVGTTQLLMPSSTSAATFRIAVADQFGGGRPDFAYRMRVLYADNIVPTQIGTGGDQIVITGAGFRSGNRVTVNGVVATVVSVGATQIVAVAPSMTMAGAAVGAAVDVAVVDRSTGGTTVIVGALTYVQGLQPVRSVSISQPSVYVAAGATVAFGLDATAFQNGTTAAALPLVWTGSGLDVTTSSGMTDSNGLLHAVATLKGAIAGSTNTATVCGWSTVCASWTAYGVDASQLQVTVISGAGQSVANGRTLTPVVLRITDTAGHPVQAATVSVHQDVQGWEGKCPVQGRCAAAPVLMTTSTSLTTDANGSVTITPQSVAGQPQVVNIVATTGSTGFVALSLTITP